VGIYGEIREWVLPSFSELIETVSMRVARRVRFVEVVGMVIRLVDVVTPFAAAVVVPSGDFSGLMAIITNMLVIILM
jgi:hypothetical protein